MDSNYTVTKVSARIDPSFWELEGYKGLKGEVPVRVTKI